MLQVLHSNEQPKASNRSETFLRMSVLIRMVSPDVSAYAPESEFCPLSLAFCALTSLSPCSRMRVLPFLRLPFYVLTSPFLSDFQPVSSDTRSLRLNFSIFLRSPGCEFCPSLARFLYPDV